jgi:hypothetical protein
MLDYLFSTTLRDIENFQVYFVDKGSHIILDVTCSRI